MHGKDRLHRGRDPRRLMYAPIFLTRKPEHQCKSSTVGKSAAMKEHLSNLLLGNLRLG